MSNEVFYASAATVIPLLLIAVMATRTLKPGEFNQQPASTLVIFGLPLAGELAAFAFLFFEPVPAAAAVILALVTWAGVISQLGLAAWWLAELIRRDEARAPGRHVAGRMDDGDSPESPARSRLPGRFCPVCGRPLEDSARFCGDCGYARKPPPGAAPPVTAAVYDAPPAGEDEPKRPGRRGGKSICPMCARPLTGNELVCPMCGTSVQ